MLNQYTQFMKDVPFCVAMCHISLCDDKENRVVIQKTRFWIVTGFGKPFRGEEATLHENRTSKLVAMDREPMIKHV